MGLLLFAFAATRAAGGWLADHPDRYRAGGTTVTGDTDLYRGWATQIARNGRAAYGDVKIEYPPGSLPFMVLPLSVSDGHEYRSPFIALMLVVDAIGLVGLIVLALRSGSWWGPWAWTLLVPMLGPIAYLRLDLVPAVATIWALQRAQAGGWFGAGGWLGFGAVAKIYPGLLVPLVLAARWRWRIVTGAVVVAGAGLLPFVGSLPGLWDSVVGYHSSRGLQVESTGGSLLLLGRHLGHPAQVVFDHGAFNSVGGGAGLLKTASLALSLVALAIGVWLSAKRVRPESTADLATVMFGTLALLLAAGTVFSPQFMIWLSALGAAAAGIAARHLRVPLVLLAAANLCSQLVFPFHYDGLLAIHTSPVAVVVVRNLLVLAIGVIVLGRLWLAGATPPDDAGPGPATAVIAAERS